MFFHRLVVCGLLALRNFSTLDRMVISLKVWWLVFFALIASWKAHAGSDKTNLYAKEILPSCRSIAMTVMVMVRKRKVGPRYPLEPGGDYGRSPILEEGGENLHRRNMPPADMEQPGDKEIDRILSWIEEYASITIRKRPNRGVWS